MVPMIDIQRATTSSAVPGNDALERACCATLAYCDRRGAVSLRVTDREEMQALNAQFRGKPMPTNVLSFPADVEIEEGMLLLGDIVLCAPVVETEALAQNKTTDAHYLHMVVHGTLHLLGYDHIDDDDARIMEQCEREVLARLGIADPYSHSAAMSTAPAGQQTSING